MIRYIWTMAVLIAVSPTLAEMGPSHEGPAYSEREIRGDLELERAVMERAAGLRPMLQPEAKVKLDHIVRGLLVHLASNSGDGDLDPCAFVFREASGRFDRLSGEQSDLLCFGALSETVRILALPEDQREDYLVGNGISEEMSLRLQMATDRRSKIFSTLSNILKRIDSTADDIVQNLK